MTVSELRKAMEGLPDDMPCALVQRDGRIDFAIYTSVRGIIHDLSNGPSDPELYEAGTGTDHFVIR